MQEERIQMSSTVHNQGDSDADRDARRSLLSETEGQEGQGLGSGDMPEVNGTVAQDGPATKVKKKNPKLRARDKPERKKELRDYSARDLCMLAPRAPKPKDDRAPVDARFMRTLQDRMLLYRLDALDALRDLAMMQISTNSMQNNVKFLAAARLLGNQKDEPPPSTGMDVTLSALNEAYHTQSRRIKEVRERVVTFEDENIINGG
jgi:hypothetical protein